MDAEKLNVILRFNESHSENIESKITTLSNKLGIDLGIIVRDISQVSTLAIQKSNLNESFDILFAPIPSEEIGALTYWGIDRGYVLINTTLSLANINFATAHELYHILYQSDERRTNYIATCEEYDYESIENMEQEYNANLFAANLLMPKKNFENSFHMLRQAKPDEAITDIITKLMSMFQVPYAATLIRCLELKLLIKKDITPEILGYKKTAIEEDFTKNGLNTYILKPTYLNTFDNYLEKVNLQGQELVKSGIIRKKDYASSIQNIKDIVSKIETEQECK